MKEQQAGQLQQIRQDISKLNETNQALVAIEKEKLRVQNATFLRAVYEDVHDRYYGHFSMYCKTCNSGSF